MVGGGVLLLGGWWWSRNSYMYSVPYLGGGKGGAAPPWPPRFVSLCVCVTHIFLACACVIRVFSPRASPAAG